MFKWLNDNTIGRIKRWHSRQLMRMVGELRQKHFQESAKNVPEELKEYHSLEMLMNNNATALHNLYKKAKDTKRFQEAFLYFFYEFEINLKHMIMSEMMVKNSLEMLRQNKNDYFLAYSDNTVKNIQKIGYISELIEEFCKIYDNEIKDNLMEINRARNFIIHNMLKEKMNEEQIKKSFEYFFTVTNGQINKVSGFFLKIIKERPQKIFASIGQLKK